MNKDESRNPMKQDLMEGLYWNSFKWTRNEYAEELGIWLDSSMIDVLMEGGRENSLEDLSHLAHLGIQRVIG